MCGIAGFIKRDAPPREAELRRMAALLGHRGPDDAGIVVKGSAGLAHTRLSIIDLEGGHQPLFDRDGGLILAANGEIYNYIELQRELEARGRAFGTRSDSETILQGYAVHGRDFLRRLHGMFAFALYDHRRRELLLARDRLGIKPLFYCVLPDRVAFASEIKALLPLLPSPPKINARALIQFLQSQFSTGEETILHGIRRLAPGTSLTVDADLNCLERRYWSALEIETEDRSFAEASAAFDGLMETVMREHMRSDVPYGLFLSGGVDSAVLLAMLDRFQDKPVRCFSVGYAAARTRGELEDAERIAGRFNTHYTPLALDQKSVFSRLPHTVWAADDLMRDYACLPTAILAERAGEELKVVFSGEGGDEAFAGYRRYRSARPERWLKGLLRPGSGGFRTSGQLKHRWARQLFNDRLHAAGPAIRQPFVDAWKQTPGDWSHVQRCQYTDLVTALPDNLLVKADRMLMAFGVEGRVPFLDHRIVEFGLALPDELKIQPGEGKVFLKRWAEQWLPKDHLYRQKRGFHVPIGEWLRGRFIDRLADKLPDNPAVREWFHPPAVSRLLAHQHSGGNASREIWCLMQFAIWHRLFIEQPGTTPEPEEDPLDWIS